MTEAQELKRCVLNGYAPGDYMCACSECGGRFMGDKRAWHCLGCAVKLVKTASRAAALEEAAKVAEQIDEDGSRLWPDGPEIAAAIRAEAQKDGE